MGLYDRDYTQEKNDSQPGYAPQMRLGFPSLTPVVKWLLIANVSVFLINIIFSSHEETGITFLQTYFALYPISWFYIAQIWRLITYQFLHANFMHLLYNMLGLAFLGPSLERQWGGKKFLTFYLSCGIAGGLCYIFLVKIGVLELGFLIGASGAVLGVLTACAILFPHFVVFIVIFPVPIRVAAVILMGIAFYTVLSKGANAGGEACHFAGIAVGAIYVFSDSWRTTLNLRFKASRWEKHIESERRLRIEVDRILKKVHDHGIQSLTPSEKSILKKATRLEQERLRK
ncbi:MAG: rhomboid family intramembrane serine protease [Sedimentisphaerales bacterium]|jgi:membrane associated rhomboid family serine protease